MSSCRREVDFGELVAIMIMAPAALVGWFWDRFIKREEK